jgi:hypothetical protein
MQLSKLWYTTIGQLIFQRFFKDYRQICWKSLICGIASGQEVRTIGSSESFCQNVRARETAPRDYLVTSDGTNSVRVSNQHRPIISMFSVNFSVQRAFAS